MANAVDERTRALQERSSALVTAQASDPRADIAAERRRASFAPEPLTYLLNGGKAKVERRAELARILTQTPWADKSNRHFLSREEEYVGGLRAALGIWRKMKDEGLGMQDGLMMRQLVDWPGGLELHIGMFIPTIMSQGDAEQQAKWMPLCTSLQVIGTYAQTELGHGTFVRGLETTATFDKQTQEFVIHSPTLSSTKWWPGGLGKTATHAVVMARLMLPDAATGRVADHGPHAFIVQLRCPDTHRPLRGVTVGDIGPKFGFNGVDNGFLQLDHVRIPRDHMMQRFSRVTPEGVYVPPPPANAKASYATMLYVRADIVRNAGYFLGRATTIAVRYAAVRRQTAPAPGERELQVLDYQNTSGTLLPLVAATYALWLMGDDMMAKYKRFEADRDRGEFGALPELHALSSGLKAVCTWITADGIEECRRTCGGHGYSQLSGLPSLFASYVQNVTWEGDNNVLCLQTARFILKTMAASAAKGGAGPAPGGSAAHLAAGELRRELGARCAARDEACWLQPDTVAAALRHRASRLAVTAADTLRAAAGGRLAFEGAPWNGSTLALIAAARAHCELQLALNFYAALQRWSSEGALSPVCLAALSRLAALFGLGRLELGLADLLEDGYMNGAQAAALRRASRGLLAALRPDAVALVDAFGFEDYYLHSALGRHDGDVYRALLDMAQPSPLNATEEGPAWEGVLRPAMQAARRGGGGVAPPLSKL
ncbi:peroxisomal acyl-coenzyme A oxidase [Raphidocelis subcapitata]|uniref:Acyl-coenzyme A oxidase n=1 Tax=Raphidocelis subcapitata TaxID=307507 RepID=A0A2V0PEU2_9CHLO|nr:peroxisomal acyl-coenzyme A oxidase [Raphidocelis subcapitata]|eukprot:GBF98378.1 peroxisomal acyl-coenzyme A oxidase [Raphidocelis subcapitata]